MKRRKNNSNRKIIYILGVLVLIGIGYYMLSSKSTQNTTLPKTNDINANIAPTPKTGAIKDFTGKEFRELYDNFAYPNTALISEESSITGNPAADKRIREIAKTRGYKSRSAPVSDTLRDVGGGLYLQQMAVEPWLNMKSATKKDGIEISLSAAYRSAADQRQIFLSRLGGLSLTQIASGGANTQINNLLRTTAVPGFSRHHTGYTIDIKCDSQPSVTFENSVCFRWLSTNNYANAKQQGWIPSYPEGAGQQGPDPESWEYVWVGTDTLR